MGCQGVLPIGSSYDNSFWCAQIFVNGDIEEFDWSNQVFWAWEYFFPRRCWTRQRLRLEPVDLYVLAIVTNSRSATLGGQSLHSLVYFFHIGFSNMDMLYRHSLFF